MTESKISTGEIFIDATESKNPTIVPVRVSSNAGLSLFTHALVDDDSKDTLVREDVAKSLDVKTNGTNTVPLHNTITVKPTDRSPLPDIKSVVIVPRDKFKVPSECFRLPSLKPNDIPIIIGADANDQLHQSHTTPEHCTDPDPIPRSAVDISDFTNESSYH